MSINSIQYTAMYNSMKNGQVGNAVDTMEDKALEYAKANNVSKEDAMDVLFEEYKTATGGNFLDDVQNNSKNTSDFWGGFLEGIDIFDLADTTTTSQALNDLANIEPTKQEKAGKNIGAIAGVAIMTGIGALLGGGVGAIVGHKLAKAIFGAKIIGGIANVFGAGGAIANAGKPSSQKNAGEAEFIPTAPQPINNETETIDDTSYDNLVEIEDIEDETEE